MDQMMRALLRVETCAFFASMGKYLESRLLMLIRPLLSW